MKRPMAFVLIAIAGVVTWVAIAVIDSRPRYKAIELDAVIRYEGRDYRAVANQELEIRPFSDAFRDVRGTRTKARGSAAVFNIPGRGPIVMVMSGSSGGPYGQYVTAICQIDRTGMRPGAQADALAAVQECQIPHERPPFTVEITAAGVQKVDLSGVGDFIFVSGIYRRSKEVPIQMSVRDLAKQFTTKTGHIPVIPYNGLQLILSVYDFADDQF